MRPHVAEIWRHPIKSCGREPVARTLLTEHRTIPWDRRWAIAHEMAEIDVSHPDWAPCNNFARVAKAPAMQAITAQSHLRNGTVTLSHPKYPDLTIDPDDPEDAMALIQWIMPLSPGARALPAHVVRAPKRGMTDTDYPSISLINLASHAEVAEQIGRPISHLRWRANLVIGGLEPWAERDLIGKRVRVGLAELEIRENITRCLATAASTETGERDADTLGALQEGWGHKEFGVYAEVVKTGDLTQGDDFEVLG
jgi:uncharacterized protein YcbX